jgi:hypothetical protein
LQRTVDRIVGLEAQRRAQRYDSAYLFGAIWPMRASSWNQISIGVAGGRPSRWAAR